MPDLLPTPPTFPQCRDARQTLADLLLFVPLKDAKQIAPQVADLTDFFTACETLAHFAHADDHEHDN